MKKKALGKGLEALLDDMCLLDSEGALSEVAELDEIDARQSECEAAKGGEDLISSSSSNYPKRRSTGEYSKLGSLAFMSLDELRPGIYQPRQDVSSSGLEGLAESIRQKGVIQPIIVRPLEKESGFEIIAGERRWRAAKIAGLHEVPVVVRAMDDSTAVAVALIENIQREALNPIELATAFKRLQRDFNLTQERVARIVGKSRVAIANTLRLLKLEKNVLRMVEAGDLEMGHGRTLLGLTGQIQEDAARLVVKRGMTVRQTETFVKKLQAMPESEQVVDDDDSAIKRDQRLLMRDLDKVQEEISSRLGMTAKLSFNPKASRGRVSIPFTSTEELNAILSKIAKEGMSL